MPMPVAELVPAIDPHIRPGARIPRMAKSHQAQSEIDRSLPTGESLPVPAAPGTRCQPAR